APPPPPPPPLPIVRGGRGGGGLVCRRGGPGPPRPPPPPPRPVGPPERGAPLAQPSPPLGGRIAVGDDAGAGLGEEPALRAEEGADGDRELQIAGAGEPADRAAVRAALDAFQLVDDLHRPDLRRAAQRSRRERRAERVDRAEARPEQPADLAGHVHHVAEPLGFHQLFDADAADPAGPADVVAPEVDQHHVLGALLRVVAHLGFETKVLVDRRAAA